MSGNNFECLFSSVLSLTANRGTMKNKIIHSASSQGWLLADVLHSKSLKIALIELFHRRVLL
jgi:hypothetical protein